MEKGYFSVIVQVYSFFKSTKHSVNLYNLLWLIIIIICYHLFMLKFRIFLQFYIRTCVKVSTVNSFQLFCIKNEGCLLVFVLIVSISKLSSVVHALVVIELFSFSLWCVVVTIGLSK